MKRPKKARASAPAPGVADEQLSTGSNGFEAGESPEVAEASASAPEAQAAPAAVSRPAQPVQPANQVQDEDDTQPFDVDDDEQPLPPRDPVLSLRLSKQLHDRLIRTAREEGVPVESLVQELLAEGVTLRAWEIIERKSAMRGLNQGGNPQQSGPNGNRFGGNAQGGNPQGNRHQGNNRGPGGPGGGNRYNSNNANNRGRPQNNAWMEDKAAFLEYVRNQEKRRR